MLRTQYDRRRDRQAARNIDQDTCRRDQLRARCALLISDYKRDLQLAYLPTPCRRFRDQHAVYACGDRPADKTPRATLPLVLDACRPPIVATRGGCLVVQRGSLAARRRSGAGSGTTNLCRIPGIVGRHARALLRRQRIALSRQHHHRYVIAPAALIGEIDQAIARALGRGRVGNRARQFSIRHMQR